MKKYLFLFAVIFLYSSLLSGQSLQNDVVASAGESNKTELAEVSWTIGECIVSSYNNEDCMATQGFQQSFLIISLTPEKNEPSFKIQVYPNPAHDYIKVKINSSQPTDEYYLELLNMHGKVLQKFQTNSGSLKRINLVSLPDGYLMLRITSLESNLSRTFKLVRVN